MKNDFNNAKTKQRIATDSYQKTKKGLTSGIYGHQKAHSKTRGHPEPEYSMNELRDWMWSQPLFHELYNNWKNSGYSKDKRPSIDRKIDDIHYILSNIQLTTWEQNNKKGHKNRKNAISTQGSVCKRVSKFSLSWEYVCEYISQHEASRDTGVYQDYISKCCRGIRPTGGGYIWKFTKDMS